MKGRLAMNKNMYAIIPCVLICLIGCESRQGNDSYFLDKDYDFVLGFAVPDEDRLVPTEVFVGKMLDLAEEGELPVMADSFLMEQIKWYHSWYHSKIEWHDDAQVYISSETQRIQLQYVGFGTYRDVNNELNIVPLNKYKLEVYRPNNRYYTSEVIVPGDYDFIELQNGDTLGPFFPHRLSNKTCLVGVTVPWSVSQRSHMYWMKTFYDTISMTLHGIPYVKAATFDTDILGVNAFYDQSDDSDTLRYFIHQVFAFDTATSRFYQKDGIALNREVDSFLTYWDQTVPIYKRSGLNTHGHDDAIGNFSSYNAARVNFYIWGKKDSCGF